MIKKVFTIVLGLLFIGLVSNIDAQTIYLSDTVSGSTNYTSTIGIQARVVGNGTSFKGNTLGRLGTASAYYAVGAGYGVLGNVTNLRKLSRSKAGATYGFGGVFGVTMDNLVSSATNGANCEVVGVKGSVSGTISSLTGPTLISAVYGVDNVKSHNSWAGYFDGNLGVNGTLKAEAIYVENVAADFVFSEGYNLRKLSEVEDFIQENRHLPDVAPASETVKGIEVGEFNTVLLQKIEELTLYIIEQNKRIESLEAQNDN